jgi:hypothetical protein
MPIESVPETSLKYYLINFDAVGNERKESDGSLLSQTLLDSLAKESFSDVFIFSHGWLGDIPAARSQYNRWIQAMAKNTADIDKLKQIRPNYNPLLIGLHWPSLPWGDEQIPAGSQEEAVQAMVSHYAGQIADSAAARTAIETIFTEALGDMAPDELSEKTVAAYQVLNQEASVGSEGDELSIEDERDQYDPEGIYEEAQTTETDITGDGEDFGLVDSGKFILSKVFSPLRTLSYWRMKARARTIGEGAGFALLTKLQQATAADVKFHLVGHSFGCIVVSATLAGPKAKGVLPRPVNSLSLVQGAVSIWSYCLDIPVARGKSGYFYPLIADGKIAGPIITTLSSLDSAVGKMYPLACGIALSKADFDAMNLPYYGGIGAFGIQGDGVPLNNMQMLPCDRDYSFEAGKIYNLESSKYICKIPPDAGLGGAHSSIDEPEVAHAVWMAVMGQ